MKRFFALLIALIMVCPLAFAVIPAKDTVVNSVTYQVPEAIVEKNIQAQVDAYISSLEKEISILRSDRDYTYRTEKVETKYVTRSGFPGNQPTNGILFKTGGSFFWAETGGPTLDASVTFSDPFQMVSVTVDLGLKSESFTGCSIDVPSKDAYYKLYVTKKMRVDKYVTYQTSLITGETRVYMTTYPTDMDSYILDVVKV